MSLAVQPRPAPGAPRSEDLPSSMIGRITLIIDVFENRFSRLTLEEIACRTRLPRSTAHRILDQLVGCQWLEHTPSGYHLGPRALGLGGQDGSRGEIREAAAPLLHELHVRTGAVVHLAVLEGAEVVYLDKVGGRRAGRVPSRVGGHAPAHATGLGKSMLAWLSPEEADQVLPEYLPRRTPRTITAQSTLRQELDRVRRRQGLAFDRGEASAGIGCAAACLRGPEGPVAAVSLCGAEDALRLESVAPLVVGAAREAARRLFPPRGSGAPRRRPETRTSPEGAWTPEAMDRIVAAGAGGEWF